MYLYGIIIGVKLYLSSYRIPTPDALAQLIGKPLSDIKVALITNAKDYYIERAKKFKVEQAAQYLEQFGMQVTPIDLRRYSKAARIKKDIVGHDLVWCMGGNTYMLRYEMHRSGFDDIIHELLQQGIVYGGESAGALVAGTSIAGVESADEPSFAESVVNEGLHLVPFTILPHIDNPDFAMVPEIFRALHANTPSIELTDNQAVIFENDNYYISTKVL